MALLPKVNLRRIPKNRCAHLPLEQLLKKCLCQARHVSHGQSTPDYSATRTEINNRLDRWKRPQLEFLHNKDTPQNLMCMTFPLQTMNRCPWFRESEGDIAPMETRPSLRLSDLRSQATQRMEIVTCRHKRGRRCPCPVETRSFLQLSDP